jgi:hypothetical protein
MTCLTIYDPATDTRRPATQDDIDRMQNYIIATKLQPVPLPPQSDPANTNFDFRLAVYPNPMRSDGVFVAELKSIEPYSNVTTPDGRLSYPATPDTPWAIRAQITPLFAFELVRRWNLIGDKRL